MPFVPTRKQLTSLYELLDQLERERIKLRVVRFNGYSDDVTYNVIEVLCLEEEDRYLVYYNGKTINK